MLNGYAEGRMRFSFDRTGEYYSITLENGKESRPVYSESDNVTTSRVTPEQVAYDTAKSIYDDHPSFATDVTQDLQNKKDYYARD
jgi:hypothetical protein